MTYQFSTSAKNFAYMEHKGHRGQIVDKRIRESGMNKTEVAKRVGRSRNQLRLWLDEPELDFDKIAKIGLAIRYDFANDFPEVNAFKTAAILEEPQGEYNRVNELLSQVDYWKTIAYQKTDALQQRLEEILELQKQLQDVKEQVYKLNKSA